MDWRRRWASPGDIRVIQPPVGGAFGSKLDVYPYEPIAACWRGKPAGEGALRARRSSGPPTSAGGDHPHAHRLQPAMVLTFRSADVLLDNGAYTSGGRPSR